MSDRARDTYINTFRAAAVIITLPLSFFLSAALANLSPLGILVPGIILTLLWGSFILLWREVRGGFAVSFIAAGTMWSGLLYLTVRRVLYILQDGRMEDADGHGSPLAFLVGMFFEQWLFLPLSAVMVGGVMYMLRPRNRLVSQVD